jgi:hypothetical protein
MLRERRILLYLQRKIPLTLSGFEVCKDKTLCDYMTV